MKNLVDKQINLLCCFVLFHMLYIQDIICLREASHQYVIFGYWNILRGRHSFCSDTLWSSFANRAYIKPELCLSSIRQF